MIEKQRMILYKTNFLLSIFNLMNAILGSGILGLAYAVKSLGILLYILMLMGVAGMAFYAITLLLNMCQITGYRVSRQKSSAFQILHHFF